MYEVYRIRGAVADVINHNGDVVPVDVRDPDLDRYADTESDTIPEAEKPPKQPVVEATGAVALGAYFLWRLLAACRSRRLRTYARLSRQGIEALVDHTKLALTHS